MVFLNSGLSLKLLFQLPANTLVDIKTITNRYVNFSKIFFITNTLLEELLGCATDGNLGLDYPLAWEVNFSLNEVLNAPNS